MQWTEASNGEREVDPDLTRLRWNLIRELPVDFAGPLADKVNGVRRQMDPDVDLYSTADVMIAISETPRSFFSHNSPDVEILVQPGRRLDAKAVHDLIRRWIVLWFRDNDGGEIVTVVDIIVDADRVYGSTNNLVTHAKSTWDDNEI
jgi:hypothetical protein